MDSSFLSKISSALCECHTNLARFQIILLRLSYFRSFSLSNIPWTFLDDVVTSFLPNDLRTEFVSCVLSSSERNCIPVVGGSQIEQEILIALVFSLVEKEDVAKVAVKALVRSDRNRRAWNFTDFYFQDARKRPIRNLVTWRIATHRRTATRQGFLCRRLMWQILYKSTIYYL